MDKKMKRLTALLVLMMAVLSGCGKNEESMLQEEAEVVVEEMTGQEETLTEDVAETEVPLSVHTTTNYKTYYFDESDEEYLYLRYCDITLEGDGFENLKRNVENWSMERSEELRSFYAELEDEAKDKAEERGSFFTSYTLYQTVSNARIDEQVVSLVDETYYDTGDEQGTVWRMGVNFDSQTGKRLELEDILIDAESFKEDAKQRMTEKLVQLHGEELFEDYEQRIAGLWQDENELQWYLDATGVVLIVQQYEVGPYNIGTTEIHMPYAEFGSYMKEAYMPAVSEGMARIEKNEEVYLKLPNIEETLLLKLQFEWEEYQTNCALILGNDKTTLSDFAAMEDAYLIRNGEEIYCLVELDMASDDYITYVFRLTNGVIDEVAEVSGAMDAGNVNSDKVMIESWINMLGTYGGVKTYCFDEALGFTTDNTEYQFPKNEFVLTTTADLSILLDEVESVLPAGSHIVINASDNETYVNFTIPETGQTGVLKVERNREEYQVMINGMSEYDCFETLPYAG